VVRGLKMQALDSRSPAGAWLRAKRNLKWPELPAISDGLERSSWRFRGSANDLCWGPVQGLSALASPGRSYFAIRGSPGTSASRLRLPGSSRHAPDLRSDSAREPVLAGFLVRVQNLFSAVPAPSWFSLKSFSLSLFVSWTRISCLMFSDEPSLCSWL